MGKSKICITAFLTAALSMNIYAAPKDPVLRDPMREIENTQRLLELRQKQEYINEQLKYPLRHEQVEEKDGIEELEEGKKYKFKVIKLQNAKLFKKEAEVVIKEYINKEMSKNDIYELLTRLSNIYLERGYTTTLVTLKSGNVKKGELVYEVKDGRVRDIKMLNRETTFMDKVKIKGAFPIKKNDFLTTQDIDQGLENMNIGGYNNTMEISATEEYGLSDILIEENYRSTGFSFGIDDSGYKDKGRNKVNLNFSQDNLLGINDRFTFNYIERLTKDRDLDRESNYDVGYSIPFGYWKLSYNYNVGDTFNSAPGHNVIHEIENRSEKHKLKLSRVIARGQYYKSTVHAGVVYKDNKNIVDGVKVDVGSKNYTNTLLGIDYTDRLFGGTFFGMLEYERGVKWFGAEGDDKHADPSTLPAKREYDKININMDWMKMFGVKGHTFQYRMGIGGSYSEDRLLSANQFTMGDEYTVRGFKESSVVGNKGIYMNNTITYMGTRDMNKYLAMFKPFIGLDGGISRDKDLPKDDKILGMALGLKFSAGGLNGSFTYGIPLVWADGMPKEDNVIYFNMNYYL